MRVGIIGGGIAGLTLAIRMYEAGHTPLVIDKGSRIGGRVSSRAWHDRAFDHGAQYFTVRDSRFREFLDKHVPPSSWARWDGRFANLENGVLVADQPAAPRYVGVPGMGTIPEKLAEHVVYREETKVVRLAGEPGRWVLIDDQEGEIGPFEWVVATAPPIQSAALLEGRSPIAAEIAKVEMLPCFACAITPSNGSSLPFDGIRCRHPVIAWAANNQSKPGRPPGPTIMIHSGPEWTRDHLSDEHPIIWRRLEEAAAEVFGVDFGADAIGTIHRWLYARPAEPLGRPCLVDPVARLAACGDWCVSAKVEGAFLSGDACAEAILGPSAV